LKKRALQWRKLALHIEDPEAGRLARQLADATGESVTEAVVKALRERLATQSRQTGDNRGAKEILRETRLRLARYPVRDKRTVEQILGYGANFARTD
jgi:antitoxin VapB